MGKNIDNFDKKAIAILKKYYIPYTMDGRPSAEEVEKGIMSGVLVENETTTHDIMTKTIKKLAEKISLEDAAKGFLYSLSTGDLRYRTVIATLLWARALPVHSAEVKKEYKIEKCKICGCMQGLHGEEKIDFNKYGVFHYLTPVTYGNNPDLGRLEYALQDLKKFDSLPKVEPKDKDYEILNAIFGVVSTMKSHNKASALVSAIHKQKIIEESAHGVHLVLGVLSMCGILQTDEHQGYLYGFTQSDDRNFELDNDLYYPLLYWKGSHGINRAAVAEIFGAFAEDKLSGEKEIASDLSAAIMATEPKKKKSKAQQYFKEDEYLLDLNDRYRYYYGLTPISEKWDKEVSYASVHSLNKKMTIFFEGDVIKKFILEEITIRENEENTSRFYQECDLDAPTKGRKLLLPKTSRGTEKPLRPSDLCNPTYMCAHLSVRLDKEGNIISFNSSNDQELPLPMVRIRNQKDFEEYTEQYIASCPDDYDQLLDNFLHKKRVTVDIKPGDIFRVQVTPTLYTYSLILGRVYDIWKCEGIPKHHPIFMQMAQPIAYRQYAVITDRKDMTAKELEEYPLMMVDVAQDNLVYWETYPTVSHKELTPSDVELGFVVSKRFRAENVQKDAGLYLYWGLAECELESKTGLLEELRAWSERRPAEVLPVNYHTRMSIQVAYTLANKDLMNVKEPSIKRYKEQQKYFNEGKELIIKHLGLNPKDSYDDFATKFGGVSRKQLADFLNDLGNVKK